MARCMGKAHRVSTLCFVFLGVTGCEGMETPVGSTDLEWPTFTVFELPSNAGSAPFRIETTVPRGYRGPRVVRIYDADGELAVERVVNSFQEMVSPDVVQEAREIMANPELSGRIRHARERLADPKGVNK